MTVINKEAATDRPSERSFRSLECPDIWPNRRATDSLLGENWIARLSNGIGRRRSPTLWAPDGLLPEVLLPLSAAFRLVRAICLAVVILALRRLPDAPRPPYSQIDGRPELFGARRVGTPSRSAKPVLCAELQALHHLV